MTASMNNSTCGVGTRGVEKPDGLASSALLRIDSWQQLKSFLSVFVLVFIVPIAASCQKGPDLVRIIDSEVIDSLLAAVPHSLINTDAMDLQTWYLDKAMAQAQDSLALGPYFYYTIAQDSFYINDVINNHIFVAGLDGPLQRRVGNTGEGPLEFSYLWGILFNGDHFFAVEPNRIQLLSRELSYVDILPKGGDQDLATGSRVNLAASRTHLYAQCARGHAYRICPRRSEAPFEEEAPFLPSLDLDSTQPPLNSSPLMTSTVDGRYVLAAFAGLPYIFVFNRAHEHVHTIRFYGSVIDEHAQNYAIREGGPPGAGVGLRTLWRSVAISGTDMIMASMGKQVFFVRILEGQRFEHVATVQFSATPSADGDGSEVEPVAPDMLFLYKDYLYVSGFKVPHILRYRVDL
jgi:hypothetical protein